MLVKTSPCAVPSERRAVASPGDVRSKVRVPDVVIWPDGDTVTGVQKEDKDNALIDFRIKTFEFWVSGTWEQLFIRQDTLCHVIHIYFFFFFLPLFN